MSGTLGRAWQPVSNGVDSCELGTYPPACAPYCDWCSTCGTAPSDRGGPQPVLNELLAFRHRLGLLPRHLGNVTNQLGSLEFLTTPN